MFKDIWDKLNKRVRRNQPFLIIFFLIILFICVYFINNIFVIIYPGEAGVKYLLFFGGTVVDKVYPEGFHLMWPWDKMYKYNVRVQQIAHEFDVLSKNGLKVHLYISVRYYPEYDLLGVLHQKVGPDYAETVIIPEIEQVLRLIIGQMDAEEIYTTGRSIIEKSLNEATEQVAQRFIIVDNVIIKKIVLPEQVEKAIQNKMEEKQIAEAHIYKIEKQQREAERKRIEAEMMKEYNDIVNTSLTPEILEWMAIQATLELSKSENSKVVVVGSGKRGLPIFGNIVLDEETKANSDDKNQGAVSGRINNKQTKKTSKVEPEKTSQKRNNPSGSDDNIENLMTPMNSTHVPDSSSQQKLPVISESPDKLNIGQ
jgi:regulator of protease activity HflC (stomatin/prohibitin superfamily)